MVTLVYSLDGRDLSTLDLDASPSQTHASEAEVTEHPVETGEQIVDHVRPRPRTLRIEGVVTGEPLGPRRGGASPESAFDVLERLLEAGRPLTVETSLRTYEQMVLQSWEAPRDAQTGRALLFTATFRQIRIVRSQTVDASLLSRTHPMRRIDKGEQSKTKADPALEGRSKSLAYRFGEWAGSWMGLN